MTFSGRPMKHLALCGIAAAAMVTLVLAGCGNRRSEQYRQQGDTYLRLHKYAEAEAAYRSAGEANEGNIPAKLGLGRCLAAAGKPEEALACFQEVTRIAPQDDLGHLEAATLLFKLGKAEDALATAKQLEAVNAERGGVLRAHLLLRAGQQAEALALLTGLRESMPDSSLVRTHLASALLAAGESAKAEVELKSVLEKKDPAGSTGADMLMVEALAAQSRIGEIIDQQEKLEKTPDQEMVLTQALFLGKRVEEAEPLLRAALERNPNAGWPCFVAGANLLAGNQRGEAASYFRTAAMTLPWEAVVMRGLASLQEAAAAIPSSPAGSAPGQTTEVKAAAAASKDDWQSLWRQGALVRLIDDRERLKGQEGANLKETLVSAALFLGNTALAEELAKVLPADSPLNAYLQALRDKEPQKAINALEPWNSQEGGLRLLAMNAVGYAMAVTGARGQAVQVLAACTERYPDNGVSLLNLSQVFRAANMPQFAARALAKLTASFPENIEAHVLLFRVLREADMQEAARQAAEVMFALFPDSREANLSVCGIYVDGKELALAEKVAEQYLQTHPGDVEILLTKASILLRGGRVAEALQVLGTTPSTGPLAAGVTSMMALSRALSQDWQGVVDAAGSGSPESLALTTRFILAAAYLKTGQKDPALAVLTQTGKDEPFGGYTGAVVLQALGRSTTTITDNEKALASALASTGDALIDFASGAAYQVAQLHDDAYLAFKRVDDAVSGDNDYLSDLLFGSLANAARIEDAGAEGRAVAEKHGTRPRTWLGYAGVLQKLADVDGERAALDKAAETGPDDPQVFFRRGDFFARQKDINAAAAEYRRLLELRPEDPIGNNNLAYYLLITEGDLKQALGYAQVAAKGLPYDPHVLHTLGVAQLRTNDLEQSKKNLTTALQLMPGDPSLLLDYGKLLIALGDTEGGRRHIESALVNTRSLGLDFDRKAEAEDILSKTPAAKPDPDPSSGTTT